MDDALKRIGILVIVFVGGCLVGYLLLPSKPSKVITGTKTVEVVKYYKADQVITKPDGTTIATNVQSTEHSNTQEYSKTEINNKRYALEGSYLVGSTSRAAQTQLIYNLTSSLGVGVGVHYNITRNEVMGVLTGQIRF